MRYEVAVDGQVVGHADYLMRDGVLVFHHTEVDPAYQNRGLAARLVSGALDDVRASGKRIQPTCSYVVRYVASHPEYQDLRASG